MMKICITLLFSALAYAALGAKHPHLVVIMTDDLGYADVGFNGCKDIPTPHIDSIAAHGVTFTSGYVAYPVCGPSRAAFITGRYGQRFGFERNPQYKTTDEHMGLPFTESTIADILKQVGYHCGVVGKWHLGAHPKHHPLNRGFHEFYGHLGGGHSYFPENLTIKDSYSAKNESESYRTWILKDHTPEEPSQYLTDAFSDAAVDFISRNHEQPFFLFLAYNAPHGPLEASEKYLARFPDISDPKRRTYAAMVSAVDDGVGRVLAELKKNNVEENTLIFFLSDNGGPTTKNASNNDPLRGNKGDAWEGGFRVPFAAKWPNGIPEGMTYDHPVISLDILATIAALTAAPIKPERPLDGVNLIPFLTSNKKRAPHEAIFLRKHDSGIHAVRSGDHKLVAFTKNQFVSLHNLRTDLSEAHNIAPNHPEIQKELENKYTAWNAINIEPIFLGLTHTENWKKRAERRRKKKESGSPAAQTDNDQKTDAEAWKEHYFKKFPEADTSGDGLLSWPEYKQHKTLRNRPPR